MKLMIVRHADPDYSIDSLTEKGWREAACLTERLAQTPAEHYYCSPLGRAKDTASGTLKALGRTAEECEWLREFKAPIVRPDKPHKESIPWDWLPQDWMPDARFFEYDHWFENERMQAGGVKEQYDWVTANLDALLARHGYEREGTWYRAVRPNRETIVFFCHFGVEGVLLSHLLHISPVVLWHGTCALPSSVTTLITEERREGIALFRMLSFGDLSHLYHKGEPPSSAARFRETCNSEGERID